MKKLRTTSITLAKPNVFCGFQRSNLPFIKGFESIIECTGARLDILCPSAPFSCDVEFVCAVIHRSTTYANALVIQTHMRPSLMAARATPMLSLFFEKVVAL